MAEMVEKLNSLGNQVFYHLSASTSSLSDYVKAKGINIHDKTSHCDVQHSIWKLNLDAGNEKCPIDSLWTNGAMRFFRDGDGSRKRIDRVSFNLAVVYAKELSERPYKRTGRGVICPSKDGCFCRSLDEVCIDDWLYDNGFEHKKEPKYPVHSTYNKLGRKRADWKVGEWFVEYAGMMSDKKYADNMASKEALAKDLNLKLLVLVKEDLTNLDVVLRKALSE